MDVVRQIEYEGEKLTIIEDEQGFNVIPIEHMKQIAKELLNTCKKLTEEKLSVINKHKILKNHTGMYPQVYGEDDPLWIQFCKEESEKEKIPVIQERRKVKGHVYIVKCDDTGLCKIGYSADIKTRIKNIKQASPTQIRLIATLESADCITHEEYFHNFFADKKIRGEWFSLDKNDFNKIGITENDN